MKRRSPSVNNFIPSILISSSVVSVNEASCKCRDTWHNPTISLSWNSFSQLFRTLFEMHVFDFESMHRTLFIILPDNISLVNIVDFIPAHCHFLPFVLSSMETPSLESMSPSRTHRIGKSIFNTRRNDARRLSKWTNSFTPAYALSMSSDFRTSQNFGIRID